MTDQHRRASPAATSLTIASKKTPSIAVSKPRSLRRSTRQHQPKPTKKPRAIIPAPQSVRIMQRHICGESLRQIARNEKRDRATVTKIVRSEEMQAYVQNLRESYFGLGELALVGVRRALQQSKDGRLAHEVLRNIGVVPDPEELRQRLMEMQVSSEGSLSPTELQLIEILRAAEERQKIFDLSPLPTPEEVQHNLDLANEIDRMTGGKSLSLSLSDTAEWNRLRALAEAKLRRDEK